MKDRTVLNENHKLAFGCSGIAGLYRQVSELEAETVLQAAWDLGIRHFDTAPHYGHGSAEHRLGRFLRGRSGWVLSTKVGRLLAPDLSPPAVANGFHSALPFSQRFDFSYDGIMRSVEDSFQRLGLNRIDIAYVHDIGDPDAGTNTHAHFQQLLDGGARALEELKSSDVIGSVGLGVNTVEVCERLIGKMPIDLILLAGRYTLLDQSAEVRLFERLRAHKIQLVIGGVYNSGILATGPVAGANYDYAPATPDILARVREIETICHKHDTALATVAIQFPSRSDVVASTLIGTAKVRSLERNVAQFNETVPDELWSALKGAGVIGATK
ncbi:aldo/keto reductase [Shimia sp. NS0008-38b]|uniref:aldo/keto reductase n=1 Tax=Shimia sp. NS0008-38b TaxID=3127653 RepID=UPI00333E968C